MGIVNQEQMNSLKERQDLCFEEALFAIKSGEKVKRAAWQSVRYIALESPSETGKIKRPFVYAVPLDNQATPWAPSQIDLFMNDWQIVKG